MTASYITAAAVSLLLGIASVRVERYHYWARYVGRRWLIYVCLAGQALTSAAAGLLTAVAARAANAEALWGEGPLSGFVYGCVPHGLARVPLPGFPVQDLRDPKSPLGVVLSWITQWLDHVSKRAVQTEIRSLRDDPQALIYRSWDIYWDTFFLDENIRDEVKQVQHDMIELAVGKIEDGTGPADGTGCLTNFCIGEITRRYLLPE